MSREAFLLQGGNGGYTLNAGEGSQTGSWRWVQIIEDAKFTDLQGNIDNIADLETPVNHLAGTGFGGEITTIHVESGTVIAYNK